MSELSRTAVVWFRNDLRLHDHEPLMSALKSRPAKVVCVYVLDPRHFGTTSLFDFPKTGPIRAKFLFEALSDLRKKLQAIGNDLQILRGFPEIVVPELIEKMQPCELYYHQEATDEEMKVETSLVKAFTLQGVKSHSYWGSTLYHKSDLPFEVKNLPPVFTQFRIACENNAKVRPPLAAPTTVPPAPSGVDFGLLPELNEFDLPEPNSDPRSVLQFKGGETAAFERLNHYFWETDRLKSYKLTRNGLLGADYSSKFAPWLAHGCISSRQIAAEVARYEHDRVQNDSTYWLVFELIWRVISGSLHFRPARLFFISLGLVMSRRIGFKNQACSMPGSKAKRVSHLLMPICVNCGSRVFSPIVAVRMSRVFWSKASD